MIGKLTGKVDYVGADHVIIDVGGVGYLVHCASSTLARLAVGRPRGTPQAELALLRDLGQAMRDASICGLGQTASSAIESALRIPGLVSLP